MGTIVETSAAVAIIVAVVTPALLILASASFVSTALVRLVPIIYRGRVVAAIAHDEAWAKIDATPDQLRTTRARLAEMVDRPSVYSQALTRLEKVTP
jgi:hypothetical protein